jgi:hypothetical protein
MMKSINNIKFYNFKIRCLYIILINYKILIKDNKISIKILTFKFLYYKMINKDLIIYKDKNYYSNHLNWKIMNIKVKTTQLTISKKILLIKIDHYIL